MAMSAFRLHGTDGIRGRVSHCESGESPIEKLKMQGEISPSLFALFGEAVGRITASGGLAGPHNGTSAQERGGDGPLLVIGWDRRVGNAELVSALSEGLERSGCRTILVGEVPTPGLHRSIMQLSADGGMMVTASHNPATDSGVKLFDGFGFKSMPELEEQISAEVASLWEQSLARRSMIVADGGASVEIQRFDGLECYRMGLNRWLVELSSIFNTSLSCLGNAVAECGLLIDSSGGAATEWLAAGLSRRGLASKEVSTIDIPINECCGAGELSPTASWSNSELMEGNHQHALLDALAGRLRENDGMAPWHNGDIVAAALDGDGDRCLVLEAEEGGVRVVDGDQMAFDWLNALQAVGFSSAHLAYTIESDLSLPVAGKKNGFRTTQVAVGDRWLSASLRSGFTPSGWLGSPTIPLLVGCEDSGHIIMPRRHPLSSDHWTLVGDGAATLLAHLLARAVLNDKREVLQRGWKARHTVKPSHRVRWDGDNELADEFTELVQSSLGDCELSKVEIAGETSLLLIQGVWKEVQFSIGVRNSGTEAKTAMTIKTAALSLRMEEVLARGGAFLDARLGG